MESGRSGWLLEWRAPCQSDGVADVTMRQPSSGLSLRPAYQVGTVREAG